MAAVTLKNISKTYDNGKVKAVNDVSFEVEQGELFGLIGPDGAGKTSIFRILTTVLLADKGSGHGRGTGCGKRLPGHSKQSGLYARQVFPLPGSHSC